MYVPVEEVIREMKSLASWLETLPAAASLVSPLAADVTLVPHPHITAQMLRLWLPHEGAA